jgi:hypothetical protein
MYSGALDVIAHRPTVASGVALPREIARSPSDGDTVHHAPRRLPAR